MATMKKNEMPSKAKLTVFVNIPILNEIENIETLLTKIRKELQATDYTVLIIDDGSVDGTIQYVEKIDKETTGRVTLLHRKKNASGCQRGAALLAGLKWGLAHREYDIFVEMDGDLSHRPEELMTGIELIASGKGDIAIASKYIPGSQVTNRPIGRRLVSIICNLAVRTVVTRKISDFSNGYRFYSRAAAELIPPYFIRYGSPIYLTEAVAIWLKHKQRIIEFPSTYVGRNEGLSKVRVIDLIKASIGIIEIATRFHFFGFAKVTPEAGSIIADQASQTEMPLQGEKLD